MLVIVPGRPPRLWKMEDQNPRSINNEANDAHRTYIRITGQPRAYLQRKCSAGCAVFILALCHCGDEDRGPKVDPGLVEEMGRNCWARPGKYIRQNMLVSLAERIGPCILDDELHEHAIPEPPMPNLDDKMAASGVMDAVEEEDNSDEARYDPEWS